MEVGNSETVIPNCPERFVCQMGATFVTRAGALTDYYRLTADQPGALSEQPKIG
jgi:hypothetical protein